MTSKHEKEVGWEKLEDKTKGSMFTKLKQMFLPTRRENNKEKYETDNRSRLLHQSIDEDHSKQSQLDIQNEKFNAKQNQNLLSETSSSSQKNSNLEIGAKTSLLKDW